MCDEWFKNKNKNPRTNRTIKINGPVYKQLEKECGTRGPQRVSSPVKSKSPPKPSNECDEWFKNKTKNPRTNRTIKINTKCTL
jgi:hypothetical protein